MIKVISPGLYTSIQDLGRFGNQAFGVPYSGVMDRQAASFANAILGNSPELPVLEMTMLGPKLQFEVSASICISGAEMLPKLNRRPIVNNKLVTVNAGDVLSFGKLQNGFRAYLAVSGGFKTEKVMNSYSMYAGITSKFKLEKGDHLEFAVQDKLVERSHAAIKINNGYLDLTEIKAFKGPEFDLLTTSQQELLFNKTFTISKHNNRMAYQLEEPLENNLPAIITSLVMPGTVQLTPAGKLIVLMRDCQTTGGYPRILQLKESALNTLSQKFTGQMVSFVLDMY